MAKIPDLIDGLRQHHANARSVLAFISRQLDNLERFGVADYELLADTLYYMRRFPRRIHHPIEDFIFQRLIERAATSRAQVVQIQAQHKEMYWLEDLLIDALDHPPTDSGAVAELLAHGRHYLELQRGHSEKEEYLLFPLAQAMLMTVDWEEAAEVMRKAKEDSRGTVRQLTLPIACKNLPREAAGS